MTMTEHFPWPLEYVLHEFFFKSHEEFKSFELKKGISRSKMVYFETQLLELVESSMEVPN